MKKIENILKKRLRHFGLEQIALSSLVCQRADEVSQGQFQAISFKKGILTLGVQNSSAACQLQLQQKEILQKINTSMGQDIVQRLRFKVG